MQWTVKLEASTEWGDARTFESGRLTRRVAGLASHEVGLTLDEAKVLLAELQRRVVQTQIDETVMAARVCSDCLSVRPIRDRRTRVLQTLFETVRVAAPRIKLCACVDKRPFNDVSFSPLAALLPDRCTPELRRLQAQLGARHSFREAARLLGTLLPCSPPNHASVRNRLHRAAGELHTAEARAVEEPSPPARKTASDPGIVVAIDGAHIRAVPGYQTRHLDVTVGKVEAAGRPPRRFALASSGTERPLVPFRAALAAQGWQPGVPVTVISDGEVALPELVRRAAGSDVAHILDCWHISMRVRHAEQALQGVYALEPVHDAGLDMVSYRLSRVRPLLWDGYHDEARRELFGLQHLAGGAVCLNGDRLRGSVVRFLSRCDALRGYLANKETALIDYGSRYRAGLPISTSRAEGCVDEIANARMAKRRRMRWAPHGAHRIAVARAAVLDGRLTPKRTDTGGEFGVARLFMGETVRPAHIHQGIRPGGGPERRPPGRVGEFATSVRTLSKVARPVHASSTPCPARRDGSHPLGRPQCPTRQWRPEHQPGALRQRRQPRSTTGPRHHVIRTEWP